ncbi:MAG: hypothetical protein ACI9XU_001400 [Arenicella sp.]|jgi:hypothetical protein
MFNKQLKFKFFVCLIISVIGIGSANADIVAKVTDLGLPGKAFLKTGEEIGFLDKLEHGQSVTLDAAGELTLVYFDSGIEYQYAGPASFIVGVSQPENINGEPQRVKDYKLLEKTGLKLSVDQKHRDQGALVFRAIDPYPNKVRTLSPNKTKLLSTDSSFSWASIGDGVSYEFVLTDSFGKIEYQTTVDQNQLQLPTEVTLKADRNYSWRVRTVQTGTEYVGIAKFELSAETVSESLSKSRPNITASLSEQVVYAMLLEQEGFKYDAYKQWQIMANAKPDNAAVKAKLAELSE